MFTGIIHHQGRVSSAQPSPAGLALRLDPGGWSLRPAPGDSIAVNGCCLTVVGDPSPNDLAFDVIPQTLALTTLGTWKPGLRVHLEPAATASTLLGGHLVQGHIDAVGEVLESGPTPRGWKLRVRCPQHLQPCLPPQGSVAIDGVSLTIAAAQGPDITLALIPATLSLTTLAHLRQGDRVNVEADAIAKQVVHVLRTQGLAR